MSKLIDCLWIAGAGAVGAVARYGVMQLFAWTTYPLGTLVINVTGSFVLGWLYTQFNEHADGGRVWRLAIGVGFLGAYTTFSTFMWESDRAINDAAWIRAASYLAGSLFLGLVAVRLGVTVGKGT